MKPLVTRRRFIYQCGELGRHKLRQCSFARTREVFDGFQVHECLSSAAASCLRIAIAAPFAAQLLYRKESANVCDTNDERNLSSGPTERTAYIMWVKNKSCDVRTK